MNELNIPDTWAQACIDKIFEINPRNNLDDSLEVSFVPMGTVNQYTAKIESEESRPWAKAKKGYTHFKDGDIIFAKITPCMENKKSSLCEGLRNGHGVGSTEFHVLRPPDGVHGKFVLNFVRADFFIKEAANNMKGSAGQKRVPKNWIAGQVFPIPPFKEQVRIVQKIDSCFEKINETEQNLTQVETLLSKYRESLLTKAFRGELVEQVDIDEPASALLDKIRVERESNQKDKKKKQEFAPISDEEKPFDIPESWEWVRLGELLTVSSGKMLSAKNQKGGEVPVYGGNGITGYHDVSNLEDSVIIIGRVGAKCGVVHITEKKSWVTDNALIVSFNKKIFDMNFLAELLSFLNLNQLSNSSAQPVISGEKIYRALVALPPIREQSRIIGAIRDQLDVCNQVQKDIGEKFNLCSSLKESVLSKAFQGEFVEQIPSEGTGQQLLDKIFQEKEKNKPQKKSKNRAKKNK